MMPGPGPAGPLDRRRPRVFLAVLVLLVSMVGTFGAARHGWPGPSGNGWSGGWMDGWMDGSPGGGPGRRGERVPFLAVLLLFVSPAALVGLLPRRPVLAVASSVGAVGTFLLLGFPWGPALLGPAAVLVAVVLTGQANRHLVIGWAGAALLGGALVCAAELRGTVSWGRLGGPVTDTPGFGSLLAGAAWLSVMLLVAGSIRDRSGRLAAARAAARETAAERERTAVTAERLRIARELHDVLAHSLSAINVQAGVGLHLLDRNPGQARSALTNIRDTSRDALSEVRAVLGIVRDGSTPSGSAPPGVAPSGIAPSGVAPPGLAGAGPGTVHPGEPPSDSTVPLAPTWDLTGVTKLADQARAEGLAVVLDVDPAAHALPDRLAGVVFRVVQESLTNVRRHAAGATAVRVHVRVTGDQAEVLVSDDGRSTRAGTSPGYGLLGMRERVEGAGGTLVAGPADPGPGWSVHATIPVSPAVGGEGAVAGAADPASSPPTTDGSAEEAP